MRAALRTKILIGVAVAIGGYVLFGPSDSQPVEASKAKPSVTPTRARVRSETHNPMQALYRLAHRVAAGSSAKALFSSHSWYVPPPPPPAPTIAPAEAAANAAAQAAARIPTAPPLPFSYMGSYTPDGSNPVFFLTQGDRVYDVKVGDTLDNTYSVDAFSNGQLTLTYKPLNIQQQLQVGSSQ